MTLGPLSTQRFIQAGKPQNIKSGGFRKQDLAPSCRDNNFCMEKACSNNSTMATTVIATTMRSFAACQTPPITPHQRLTPSKATEIQCSRPHLTDAEDCHVSVPREPHKGLSAEEDVPGAGCCTTKNSHMVGTGHCLETVKKLE